MIVALCGISPSIWRLSHESKAEGLKVKRRQLGLIGALLLFLLIVEIYKWLQTGQFDWPALMLVLEICVGIFLWFRFPSLKKGIGEGKFKARPRSRHLVNLFFFLIFSVPFSIYVLKGLPTQPFSGVESLSMIGISLALAGLSFAASSIPSITSKKRIELVCVAQKFIAVTILSLLFIPAIYMVDILNGININSVSLLDAEAWWRGTFFWIAVPCFYGAIFLFFLGISDLIFSLADLGSKNPTDLL